MPLTESYLEVMQVFQYLEGATCDKGAKGVVVFASSAEMAANPLARDAVKPAPVRKTWNRVDVLDYAGPEHFFKC